MNENKFRAWDKKQQKMIYFDFSNIYGYEGEVTGVVLPDGYTMLNNNGGPGEKSINTDLEITQFTGFRDKNKKEVYYYDLIKYKSDSPQIVTDISVACWVLDENAMNYPMSDIEVVGNLYDIDPKRDRDWQAVMCDIAKETWRRQTEEENAER